MKGKSQAKPCPDCGAPKPPGRGAKFCNECRDRRRTAWSRVINRRKTLLGIETRIQGGQRGRRRRDVDVPEGEKWCAYGQHFVKLTGFPLRKDTGTGKGAYCRSCQAEYAFDYRLRRTYNITAEAYWIMHDLQDGRCYICHRKPRKYGLAVDHAHSCCSGRESCGRCVRGLLCSRCNQSLAWHRDRTDGFLRAVEYLTNPPAQTWLKVAHYHLAERAAVPTVGLLREAGYDSPTASTFDLPAVDGTEDA